MGTEAGVVLSGGVGLDLNWLWASVVSALVSFAGIPVSASSAYPEFVEFRSWSSSFGVALVSHSASLGFCDWSTGFLRRDSCVPSRQRVLNSSSFVVELRLGCSRIRRSKFVRMWSVTRPFHSGKPSAGWCLSS